MSFIYIYIFVFFSSIATGFRGGVFSVTFARLNIRLRNLLFRSLMRQEIGFFDANHTGNVMAPIIAYIFLYLSLCLCMYTHTHTHTHTHIYFLKQFKILKSLFDLRLKNGQHSKCTEQKIHHHNICILHCDLSCLLCYYLLCWFLCAANRKKKRCHDAAFYL